MKTACKQIPIIALLCLAFLHPLHLFSNGPVLVLNNPVNAGFGAIFSSVLSALDTYDRGEFAGITIDLNSGIYLDKNYGPNYWEYFFEPINFRDEESPEYIFSAGDVANLINAGFVMTRERGFELIQKYIRLKPCIQNEIDFILNHSFKKSFVIGIHHRGTDKKLEASIVDYQTILFHVNWWLSHLPKDLEVRIFVATDDQQFLDHVCQLYPQKVIFNNFVRSKDDTPIHYSDSLYASNYQKGKEAVLDCLLLSKCDLLLFPAASAFSMASLKFNPFQMAIPLTGP